MNIYVPTIISEHELLIVFPEAKKICKELVKSYNSSIGYLEDFRPKYQQVLYKEFKNPKERSNWEYLVIGALINVPTAWYEIQIKRLKRLISYNSLQNVDYKKSIELARQTPIDELVVFNSMGFADCIWHNEKTGSMKYYKRDNRVHCFGCGKNGDVIDVLMKLKNCTFGECLNLKKVKI